MRIYAHRTFAPLQSFFVSWIKCLWVCLACFAIRTIRFHLKFSTSHRFTSFLDTFFFICCSFICSLVFFLLKLFSSLSLSAGVCALLQNLHAVARLVSIIQFERHVARNRIQNITHLMRTNERMNERKKGNNSKF